MAVILPSTYTDGTAVCTNGSPNVVGTGTMWLNTILPGDFFWTPSGESVRILAVVDDTHITLAYNWPGATQATGPYEIRFQSDQGRVQETTRQLLERMQSGNLYAFAGLSGAADRIPVFTGPGAMGLLTKQELTSGVNYDVQVDTLADRDDYDVENTGFAVLVSNVGDGRSAIYSKLSASSGDWSDPAYITGPVGPLAVLNPRGTYSGATAYALNDVVLYNGSSFVALQATTGNAPPTLPTTSNAYWTLIAIKGTDGAGTGDVVGPSSAVDGDLVAFNGTTGKIIKAATMNTGLIKGRITAGVGPIEDLTPSQARGVIQTDLIDGFRNKLINGGFDVWQRAVTQSATGYGSDDRWTNDHVGTTKVHTRQAFTIGQTAVPGNPSYYSRTVVTSVAGAGNYCLKQQKIENVATLSGRVATLTFWAKADASKNMWVNLLQFFGTGGSPSASVTGIGQTTVALTTSWQKFTILINIPSVAGKVLGANGNDALWVQFYFEGGTTIAATIPGIVQQSGTFEMSRASLVDGDATKEADPFYSRSIAQEIALCCRYYETTTADMGGWANGSGFAVYGSVKWRTRMRAVPTVTNSGGTNSNVGSIISDNISVDKVRWALSANSQAYTVSSNRVFTADAEL